MSRSRDISKILGATEVVNTTNIRLLQSNEEVGIDSAEVETIASGKGLKSYNALDSLPTTGLTAGDQAFVESDQRLYISNGSGWYNVALVNATPTLTLDQSGTIQLNAETLTVTVTATATDSDDNLDIITFSVESDGNMVGTGTTVSQDSSVFTITADSEGGNGVAGDFTLTFKATDNINVDTEALSFSLAFSNVIDSSAETILLLKATGTSDNRTITYQDSDNSSAEFTDEGNPQAATFTPYRSGGYSYYFNGSSYIQFAASNDWGFGYNPWAVEFWYKGTDATGDVVSAFNASSPYAGFSVSIQSGLIKVFLSDGVGSDGYDTVSGTTTVNDNEWHHVAVTSDDGNVVRCHIDGVRVDGNSGRGLVFSEAPSATGQVLRVGADTNTSPARILTGHLRDVHVTGSELYPQADFTPPTEPITATADTVLLTCQNAYMKENSTSNRTVTISGNMSTMPIGPYDYEPWTADDHGGSVYFDGNADRLELASLPDLSGGNWTIEGWYRFDADPNSATYLLWSLNDEATNGYAQLQTVSGNNYLRLQQRGGSHLTNGNTYNMQPNIWYHLATVWDGTNQKVYANGKEILSSTTNVIQNAGNGLTINGDGGGSYEFAGSIADFRISTSAQYTAEFTAPTAPLSHDANTILLMNNKSDASVYDAAAGNSAQLSLVTASTTQRKFTTSSSLYSSGGVGKNIEIPAEEHLTIGAADYTVEFWVYPTSTASGTQSMATFAGGSGFTNGNDYQSFQIARDGQNIKVNIQTGASSWGTPYTSSSNELSANAWHHVAVAREGSANRVFVDGTLLGTITSSFSFTNTNETLSILGRNRNSQYWDGGYMQDFRLTIGKARYTATFTVPSAEFEL